MLHLRAIGKYERILYVDAEIANGALDLRVSERTRVMMLIMRIAFVTKKLSGRRHQEHPVVAPQVAHLRQVPLRARVKLPHSGQESPV